MAGVETIILLSSVYVAGIVVFGSIEDCQKILGPLLPSASLVAVTIMLSLVSMGLYHFHQRFYYREAVVRLMVGLFAGSAALAIIFYAFPSLALTREVASISLGYSLVFLLLARLYFVRTVDENAFRHRTVVFGAGERAASVSDLRRRADRRGFKVVGRVAAAGDKVLDKSGLIELDGRSIADVATEAEADEIVVAMDNRRGNLPIRDLLDAKLRGIQVIDILEFLERETGKIRIDIVNPGWLIFGTGFRSSRYSKSYKRLIDIFVSGLLLSLALPIMLLIIIAIKIEDGFSAPILYRQLRVGRNNKPFNVVKFRSMRVDAEADGQAVWAQKNDSRVTRVGACLRKSRLDEIPQVLNVLRGQMSLVGPRPERPEFVEGLRESVPYYAERHTVKPGITGWAQLRYSYGASEDDAAEKLQYDLYYVKNQNIVLDIMIILQTVEVVLWGKGAR